MQAINGEYSENLRRFEAMAVLEQQVDAKNQLRVRDELGGMRMIELSSVLKPRIRTEIFPGPFRLLRIDGFATTDEETDELRAIRASLEALGQCLAILVTAHETVFGLQ